MIVEDSAASASKTFRRLSPLLASIATARASLAVVALKLSIFFQASDGVSFKLRSYRSYENFQAIAGQHSIINM